MVLPSTKKTVFVVFLLAFNNLGGVVACFSIVWVVLLLAFQ